MIYFLIIHFSVSFLTYKVMKRKLLKLLKKYKEDGYTTSRLVALKVKMGMEFLSLIPLYNIFVTYRCFNADNDAQYNFIKLNDLNDGLIFPADNDFSQIDSFINNLEKKGNMRLKINKIMKFDKIKDKIKVFKIAKILDFSSIKYLIDSHKKSNEETEQKILFNGEEVSFNEAVEELKKELDEYKEEKMKSVPIIQVRKEDENKEELLDDNRKLVPIMNFSEESDEIIDDSNKVKRL